MQKIGGYLQFRHRPASLHDGSAATMSVIATIMNSSTGLAIQKMKFERMPKPWVTFHLETGEQVTADRIYVGKSAPGKFITPVEVWVTPQG